MPRVGPAGYKRIATEEAWGTKELFREWKKVLDAKPVEEIGFLALWRNLDPTRVPRSPRIRTISWPKRAATILGATPG